MIEPGCVTLFARRLLGYHTREWSILLSKVNALFDKEPGPLDSYPAFCRKDKCGREIINVHFSGYCVACSLARKRDRKASYLLKKGEILLGLKKILGSNDPGLEALGVLGRNNQELP